METIISAVGTVGFPIAMCLLCYYTQITTMKELRETIQKNTEAIVAMTTLTQQYHTAKES